MSRVLLIEPNRILADAYSQGLERTGHTVTWLTNAQDAMASLDQHMPDVVVIELQLAVHNGIEFLYELRSYADLARLPVIVHSFLPQHEFMQGITAANLSVHEYLYKPKTSIADLSRAVSKCTPVTT